MRKTLHPSDKKEANQKGWKKADASDQKIKAAMAAIDSVSNELKESRITTRIRTADLELLKQVAAKDGVPYQTLLGSVIHKFVSGNLIDADEIRKLIPGLKIKKAI